MNVGAGLLIRLRLRGARRAARAHPLRALGLFGLLALALVGGAALALDLYREAALLPPTQEALSVAPQGASPTYAIWREIVFWGAVLLLMPSCYRSMRDLFHRPEWRAYSVLPIPARAIYFEAALLSAGFGLVWLLLGLALALPPLVEADARGALASALFVSSLWATQQLAAPAVHSFAAAAATSQGARDSLGPLAGGWVSAEAAPFLYSPAAVLAGVGFGAIPLQRGVEALVYGGGAGGAFVGLILVGALALFLLGRRYYDQALFRALPLLREAEVLIYGEHVGTNEEAYGAFLSRLLPAAARPWFLKSLRGLERGGRVRWLQVGAVLAVGLLYLLRARAAAPWFPFAAITASLFIGSVGLLLGSEPFDPAWLRRALPARGSAIVLGRVAASAFLSLHVGAPLALALWWKGWEGSLALLLSALAGGVLSGALPDVPAARRGGTALYAALCALALASGRLSLSAIPIALGATALLALLWASLRATAPEKERA